MANKKKKVDNKNANKKENLEEVVAEKVGKDEIKNNKKSKKDNKAQEEKTEKLVEEDEMEIDVDDEEYDDEEDDEEEREEKLEVNEEDVVVDDGNNEIRTLKLLTCISICISVIAVLILLVVLSKVSHIDSFYVDEENNSDNTTSEYDTSMFTEVTEDEFIDMFDKDDDEIRFVYTGQSSCSYCIAFLPYLQQSVSEYDYTLYYLDMSNLTKVTDIRELDDTLAETFGPTPMVFAIKNGEVVDYNNGYTEYSTLTSFLEENGVETK